MPRIRLRRSAMSEHKRAIEVHFSPSGGGRERAHLLGAIPLHQLEPSIGARMSAPSRSPVRYAHCQEAKFSRARVYHPPGLLPPSQLRQFGSVPAVVPRLDSLTICGRERM